MTASGGAKTRFLDFGLVDDLLDGRGVLAQFLSEGVMWDPSS